MYDNYVLSITVLIVSNFFLLDTSSRHQTSILHSQFCELSFLARAKGGCAPLNNHGLAGVLVPVLKNAPGPTIHACVVHPFVNVPTRDFHDVQIKSCLLYTVVSWASAHSRVSAQVLVLAVQMESAHSRLSTQARSLQSHMASAQAALACQHASTPKGTCSQACSTEHTCSYTKAWSTISSIVH